jgi:hypothetical protein
MELARRALVVALVVMALTAVASAQTLRYENDPRNQAPSVGTGGGPGGPTGLFTIYDGDTIRRGEFTFSVAYSNYDRDPGNVDITEIPVSFQVGLNDHLEIFYNTDAYRGVKVNNQQNLSSFYLPNTTPFVGIFPFRSGPAIILSPERVSGSTQLTGFSPLFRPAGNQPFVQFPFVGGPGPNFGLTGNRIAPPFTSRLGTPSGGEQGNFSGAANFPGIGSVVGSILPGIVLTTRTIPANLTFNTLTVPNLFTIAPSYLPDAPFISRVYGESSFSTHSFGVNWRLTGPNNPLSLNLIPIYRWYWDKADDFTGFNQLQRGASPGGDIGDFGLFGVIGGRLSRSVHIAANFGYFLNSNPQSEAFGGGKVTLLDRPDEFISGVGFDFPVNKHFQPIAELKSIRYVGGRTPNAFPNNPVEALAGVRIFPARWWGMSAWYRLHLNQQGDRPYHRFNAPDGFEESSDPHGFGVQIFAGHRNERIPPILPNQPPTVTLSASSTRVVVAAECGPGTRANPSCTPTDTTVRLSAQATDPDGDTLLYTFSSSHGRITGDGANATLDLSGVPAGTTVNVTVEVDDGCGCIAYQTVEVTVDKCDCVPIPCPTVDVSCPSDVAEGGTITFTANVSGGDPNVTPTYNWTVSAGTIASGQGTSSITVETTGLGGQTVTATVDVGGYDRSCSTSDSCTTSVTKAPQPPGSRKIDEYGAIRFNDEKARLDNAAIALQEEPGAQLYLVCYGRANKANEAMKRCRRAELYLERERQIAPDRVISVDGGVRDEPWTEIWIVPTGAVPPQGQQFMQGSEVQTETRAPRRSRRGRRGREE